MFLIYYQNKHLQRQNYSKSVLLLFGYFDNNVSVMDKDTAEF